MSDGLIVRPGDTLILTFQNPINAEIAERHKDAVMKRIPGLKDVLIISGNSPSVSAYRPETSDER